MQQTQKSMFCAIISAINADTVTSLSKKFQVDDDQIHKYVKEFEKHATNGILTEEGVAKALNLNQIHINVLGSRVLKAFSKDKYTHPHINSYVEAVRRFPFLLPC